MSGFAIHHLTHERKRALYGEIYKVLSPNGILIHIEHVASATVELETLFETLFIRNLASYQRRSEEEVKKEYETRPDREDNILIDMETQLEWLRDIGFRHVDCYFKWMELSVFGGLK